MTPADALPPLPRALQAQVDRAAAAVLPLMLYPSPGLRVVALMRVVMLADDALHQALRQIRADRMAVVEELQHRSEAEACHG
jgi:hypothetical protein